jgi:probable HAF family extracellular repeat protein
MEEQTVMKSIFTSIAAGSLLAALAIAQPSPRYTIVDLGTLGGPGTNSGAFDMNNAGWVAGSSNRIPNGPQHAFLWFGGGPLFDLGTLDGPACPACNSGAGGPNSIGEAAVGSETSTMDPNGEDFCAYGTHRQCLAAVSRFGRLKALPTLTGGHNTNTFGINNRGQLVGFAENGVADPSCATATPHQVTRFEAVIWGPSGQIQELPPLKDKGDTVAFAFGINDSGQAVGSSGSCSTQGLPPANVTGLHAVLWERDGTPTYLGTLGDAKNTMFNAATSVNNQGDAAGTSQFTDGTIHSFLWTRRSGMQDLGTLPGAVITVAACCNTLNNRGQIVGFSIDGASGNSRAFVWQNKVMTDLNTLVPAGSPWNLQGAFAINDAGEIVGQGMINGEVRAFLAIPRQGDRR